MKSFIERFEGTSVQTDEREVSSAADARAALDMLDGRVTTSVSFEAADGPTLMVSGGPRGYLASTWDDKSEESWIASEPDDRGPGEVEIVSAGQAVTVPAAQVLNRQRLDGVVECFVSDQSRSPDVRWVQD